MRQVLAIDPEFAKLCDKQDERELELLEEVLKADGCRDAIRYWRVDGKPIEECPIIDGHTRYSICNRLKIDYRVESMTFPHRSAAVIWILANQLARRNLSEVQKSLLRSRLYLERLEVERSKAAENPTTEVCGDTVSPHNPIEVSVAQAVADQTGVSKRTIHRDVKFQRALDNLETNGAERLKLAALHGHINRKDVLELGNAPVEIIKEINKVPDESLQQAAKAASQEIRDHKPHTVSGAPIVDIRSLNQLMDALGVLIRVKSQALKDCGGKPCPWAWKFHEKIRHLISGWLPGEEHIPETSPDGRTEGIMDVVLEWQKTAEANR